MQEDRLKDTLREIKQSFRLLMNGVTAQSMREKGLDYHVNWGANLLHLREMATEYAPDCQLAQALWQEDVRECKILATMLMPHEQFTQAMAEQWIGQTRSQEIAEIASMNLYQHLSYAGQLAMQLVAQPEGIRQLHGYNILSRLYAKGMLAKMPVQITAALLGQSLAVRHAALNALQRFASIDEECRAKAKDLLRTSGLEGLL